MFSAETLHLPCIKFWTQKMNYINSSLDKGLGEMHISQCVPKLPECRCLLIILYDRYSLLAPTFIPS